MKPVIYLLIAIEAGMLIYHLVQFCKNHVRGVQLTGIALCLTAAFLPLLSFQKASADYIAANQKYFGYPHYTIRTDGETAGFMERIYKIESPERNLQIWSPYDALEKAFSVSETLENDPQMRKGIFESAWTNKGESAIGGDYLSWVLVNAIWGDDQIGSAEKAEEYFAQVNRELDQAFEDGLLRKDTRLQLTSSAGGRNPEEIAELFGPLISFYAQMLTFNDFQSNPKYPVEYSENLEPFLTKLNHDIVYPQDAEDEKRMIERAEIGSEFTRMDFRVYHYVIPVLFGLGLTAWFAAFFLQFGKRETPLRVRLSLILVFFLIALSIGYTIGIVWFSQFLFWHKEYPRMMNVLIYYGPGASSMFYLGIFFAVPLWKWIITGRSERTGAALQPEKS